MRRRYSTMFSGLAILAACGGGGDSGGPTAVYELPTEGGTSAVDALPFPNELLVFEASGETSPADVLGLDADADPDAARALLDALAEGACAAVTTGVSFRITADEAFTIDETTVGDESVVLLDLQTGEAVAATRIVRQLDGSIVIEPRRGVVLAAGQRYGAYMTSAVATADGVAVAASDSFSRVARGSGSAGAETAATASLAPLLALADGETMVAATVFETCDAGRDLEAIRADIADGAAAAPALDRLISGDAIRALLGAPAIEAPGIDNPGGPSSSAIAHVILGSFDAPSYVAAEPARQGRFERGPDGVPVVKGTIALRFVLTLPASASYAETPVVIFSHGLGGDTTEIFAVANALAASGVATISIDLPLHGSRFPGAVDREHNFTGEATPDGLIDPVGANAPLYFFDVIAQPQVTFLDTRVMRDNFRQGAVDAFALVHALAEGDWAAIAAADAALDGLSFDADRIALATESFGGFVGVPVLAYEPRIRGAFLAVAGGGLATDLLEASAVYGPLFGPVVAGAFSVPQNRLDPDDAPPHTHLSNQLLTNALDGAEPLAYAARARLAGVPVTLPVANLDESVPNRSSEALARALGLAWQTELGEVDEPRWLEAGAITTAEPGAILDVTFTREPATHGMLTRQRGERKYERDGEHVVLRDPPVPVENPTAELQALLVAFIGDVFAGP